MARPTCLRLLEHLVRAAASRTFWTAGNSRPIRIAMMAMTTRSSISVKALRTRGMGHPQRRGGREEKRERQTTAEKRQARGGNKVAEGPRRGPQTPRD